VTDHEFNRRMVRTVLTIAGVAVLLAALWAARGALVLVYVSALIAMGFSPLVHLIERPATRKRRRAMPRALAIFAVYLTIIAIFVVVGLLVIPPLVEQASTLWERLPQHFNDLQRVLVRYKLETRTVTLQEAVRSAPAGSGGNALSTAWTAISRLVGGAFGLIVIIVLSFYFLIEGESVMTYATRFISPSQRAHVTSAAREAVTKVSAWLRAQLLLAAVMGTLAGVGLGLLHVPYFYVVALVAAAGETIPMLGPVVAGVTAVAISLSVSPRLAVTVGVLFLLFHQLEANILVPKLMERRVGVSPVAVLGGLLVGGSLFGLVGAILAVPTTAIISVLIEEFSAGST
jgi:predicted PurR-regulated permease PerM